MWIVGGNFNYDDQGTPYVSFGVWNYNPTADKYRWVWKPANTSSDDNYNPGEIGVESELNCPGELAYAGTSIDSNDNIWTLNKFSELWMFNTSSWNWVRIQGSSNESQSASFGANPGQAAADVWPGNRGGNLQTDSHNNLWLICGMTNNVIANNVWHFNTTSKLWRFVSGDKIPSGDAWSNATYFAGFYYANCDIDEDDKVWCYGGEGNLGDLWMYDTRSDTWTHKFGNFSVVPPNVASANDFDPDNIPSVSMGNFINRRDGTFMLITGFGYNYGMQTIWLYNVTLNQFKLLYGNISESYTPGVYVTRREAGSTRPAVGGFASQSGLNFDGDVYIHGGSFDDRFIPLLKDIWFIPQNQCATTAQKCDVNADCIDELFGYSCQCKPGYHGDGFTCALPPVVSTTAPKSATSNVSRLLGSVVWIFIAALLA